MKTTSNESSTAGWLKTSQYLPTTKSLTWNGGYTRAMFTKKGRTFFLAIKPESVETAAKLFDAKFVQWC